MASGDPEQIQMRQTTQMKQSMQMMQEAQLAHETLSAVLAKSPQAIFRLSLLDMGSQGASLVSLPRAALELLAKGLAIMARGQAARVYCLEDFIGTQEAADYLQVSRPFIVREIDAGRIPCKKVGVHRRINFADVLAYEASRSVGGAS